MSMHPKFWTPEQLTGLRHLYPHHTADVVARVVGRSMSSVYARAKLLGLAKSAEWLASDRSGRMQRGRTNPGTVSTQFRPGLTPWNKGLLGATGLHPNCRATQFQPGRLPQESRNYAPIGSLRLNADGHLERKVTDDRTLVPARRWQPVYRLAWEAEHGPIPAGHMVVFKPGMKTAELQLITTDRLECITRADNARRNHPRNKHPELARLVQLKGAITRQVNRIQREAQERAQA